MKAVTQIALTILAILIISCQAMANHVAIARNDIPRDYHGTQPYSIKYDYIQVRIDSGIAHTEVEQVLRNETNGLLETETIFPFPANSAITKYNMWMGDELMKGELLEKDKARAVYQEIVTKKKDPALMQFVGASAFKSSVYPIPPRGEKKLRFAYDETLHYDSGVYRYEYVLSTGHFSAKPFEKLVIEVKIHSKTPIKSVYSPTHDISVSRTDDCTVAVKYEETNTTPDMNFQLYYSVSEDDIGLNLMAYKEKDKDGYFLLMATPKFDVKQEDIVGKSVVFVFDHSGSMAGEKIKQARGALDFCLNSLNKKDKFNVIMFGTVVEPLNNGLVSADERNISKALDFIGKMTAIGGTDIHGALMEAMRQAGSDDTEIIFLTDGMPTIGPKAEQIAQSLNQKMGKNIRLFNFGVGYNVNIHFLDIISSEHGGFTTYVRPEEDIEIKVSDFYSKITCPVLKNIKFDFGDIVAYDIYPKELPAMFKGGQILVFGRYKSEGKTELMLSGQANEVGRKYVYKTSFPDERLENDFIPKIWASRKIGYLADQIRLNGADKELIDEIVLLSKEYGIITEYTSFLVHEDRNMTRAEMSEATEYNFSNANKVQNGAWAVSQGMNAQRLQYNGRVFDNKNNDQSGAYVSMNGRTRQVHGRAFYYRNGQWVDSTLEKYTPDKEISNFSDEYFKYNKDNEAYSEYMSLGRDVIINDNGKAVRFRD
jgi:Ca-activated chloride channel homolog